MAEVSVEERVKTIIVDELGVDEAEVTANARFIDDLGADSLDTVELVMSSRRVQHRDPGRGCRENHKRAGRSRIHREDSK